LRIEVDQLKEQVKTPLEAIVATACLEAATLV